MYVWIILPFIKAIKGNSLTFAMVVSIGVFGGSFAGILRNSLGQIGVWFPLALFLPLLATRWLARNEVRLKLRPQFQRWACWSMMGAAIALSILLSVYQNWLERDLPDLPPSTSILDRPRGPAGKR